MPTARRTRPFAVEPLTSSHTPAGSQMAHAPIGSSEKNAIVTPQNTGAPMPTAQNSRPPAAPWALATTIADTTLARIRSCAWLMTCSRCSSSNGSTRRTIRMMRLRIAEQEEQREDHDDQVEEQDADVAQQVAGRGGRERAEPSVRDRRRCPRA